VSAQDFFLNERGIREFAISPDSKLMAYLHNDPGWSGYINLYDIEKKSIIKKIDSKTIDFNSTLSFSPDYKYLAWNNYGAINIYNLTSGKIESIKINCSKFAFSPVNNLIVACSDDGASGANISLIDSKSLIVFKNIKIPWNSWNESVSYDGSSVTTYVEGKLNYCSFLQNQNIVKINLRNSYADSYSVSNNNKYFVTFGDSMTVGRFSDFTFNKYGLNKIVSNVMATCFTPLDQNIIYGTYNAYKEPNYQIYISDLSGYVINTLVSQEPRKLVFTPNGKYLVCREGFGIRFLEAKKLLPYIGFYTKYYDMYYKDYQNDLKTVFEKSKTRGEFETQEEYEVRIADAFTLKKSLDDKYYDLFSDLVNGDIAKQNSEYDKQNSEVQDKINNSIELVETKINSIGTYVIEKELLPITINGVTESIKINRDEAKSLKENFASAVVKGKKRLKYDLKNYEFFELTIIHPVSFTEYKFGNW
jgi:hypothetical protein